jgi:hypothetical protein
VSSSEPMSPPLEERDLNQIRARGITPEKIERQLEILRQPPPPIRLVRPCSPGDGIASLTERPDDLERAWRESVAQRPIKFVPASGMASRMFAFVTQFMGSGTVSIADLRQRATVGNLSAHQTVTLLENIDALAVFPALALIVRDRTGREWTQLREHDPGLLLELLAGDEGLALDRQPKGLIPFHRYAVRERTAFEEHLVEGAPYLSDGSGVASFHFTVAAGSEGAFKDHFEARRPAVERQSGIRIETEFSVQDPATDTIAVDENGRLVREVSGDILFRAGGHGSLLRNLEGIARRGFALAYIKNIDNVAEASRHGLVATWKRRIAGRAILIRNRAFELLARLDETPTKVDFLSAAADFVRRELAVELPENFDALAAPDRRRLLRARLDRPLRVCGVVVNRGEPGGGPFWVEHADGSIDGQIVEAAQVEREDPRQGGIWADSTHFNPVDIVCSLHDRHGNPYELDRFVDRSTYFVTTKVHEGTSIRVLERPGLWNGSMAGWNTCFVEVPEETFTPVKTILDLLRPAHRS